MKKILALSVVAVLCAVVVLAGDEKMGDKMVKGRFTMKMTSSASYDFMYETSPDGSKWTTAVDGKATKK